MKWAASVRTWGLLTLICYWSDWDFPRTLRQCTHTQQDKDKALGESGELGISWLCVVESLRRPGRSFPHPLSPFRMCHKCHHTHRGPPSVERVGSGGHQDRVTFLKRGQSEPGDWCEIRSLFHCGEFNSASEVSEVSAANVQNEVTFEIILFRVTDHCQCTWSFQFTK